MRECIDYTPPVGPCYSGQTPGGVVVRERRGSGGGGGEELVGGLGTHKAGQGWESQSHPHPPSTLLHPPTAMAQPWGRW